MPVVKAAIEVYTHLAMPTSAERVATRFIEGAFHVEAMANLLPRRTGIKGAVIWVSPGEFGGSDSRHGPRVKVMLGEKTTTEGIENSVSVTISQPPRVLGALPGKVKAQVIRFVTLNHDLLMQHWRGELDHVEIATQLQRV